MPGRFPTDQGFDEWYGVANTTDEAEYSSQFQYDPEAGTSPAIQEAVKGDVPRDVKPYDIAARREIDGDLTERAIDFMRRSVDAKKPFFSFIPFTQPHIPTLPHSDFDGRTGNGHFADVLAEIDFRAGQILDAVDELGIRLRPSCWQLLNFNVEPQCVPSRSAFMTGRRPIRSGTTKVVWGVLYGLTNWEVTMAAMHLSIA